MIKDIIKFPLHNKKHVDRHTLRADRQSLETTMMVLLPGMGGYVHRNLRPILYSNPFAQKRSTSRIAISMKDFFDIFIFINNLELVILVGENC